MAIVTATGEGPWSVCADLLTASIVGVTLIDVCWQVGEVRVNYTQLCTMALVQCALNMMLKVQRQGSHTHSTCCPKSYYATTP